MRYLSIFLVVLMFAGCTDHKKLADLQEKQAQLETEYRLLLEESEQKDKFVEEYTRTLNLVYDNLEHIRKREGLLNKMSENMETGQTASLKEKLLYNISSIDEYLQDTRKQLNSLKEKMYASKLKSASLEENINQLNQVVEEKETYIAELRKNVEDLNARVAQVEGELEARNEVIESQTTRLNTGFYIIGSEKELKEKGILEEKGGILGIRKAKQLAASFNPQDFNTADITLLNRLDIDRSAKKLKIISPHNPESYDLIQKDDGHTVLEILDPDAFWKIRYLVIMTKG